MATKTKTEVETLRAELSALQGRKRQLQIETENLVDDLDTLGGLDVQKAVAEASRLTMEIAGRKAVISTLTTRIAEKEAILIIAENEIQKVKAEEAKVKAKAARDKLHASLWKVYEESKRVAALSSEYRHLAGRKHSGIDPDETPVISLQNLLQDSGLAVQSSDRSFRRL